jgi:phage-related protein
MQITNVLEYLENTVKRVPDKTAYANENMEMTFGEVYHDSRAIGSYLAKNNYEITLLSKKQSIQNLENTLSLNNQSLEELYK